MALSPRLPWPARRTAADVALAFAFAFAFAFAPPPALGPAAALVLRIGGKTVGMVTDCANI